MFLSISSISLAAAGLAAGAALESRFTVGQTVQTNNGPITGQAASVATQVSEYLGIPYAQPPIGNLRFAPPVSFTGNGAMLIANKMPPSCPANGQGDITDTSIYPFSNTIQFGVNGVKIYNQILGANAPYNEDCLKLNVWTKPQTGETKKAVLVWIYGGGFAYGATNNTLYNGQFLADRQDVVVVTFNYRTNIFGFPGASNLVQNVGLLDQRLAIKWVRDNIAAFGGDPARITLFGESAGAASLDYYSLAYYNDDPIVNGFIQESGNIQQLGPATASSGVENWYKVTANLGCGDKNSDPARVLTCMRGLSTAAILGAYASTQAVFKPIVDGKTAFSDSVDRLKNGDFIKKPIILGSNDQEGNLIRPTTQGKSSVIIPQPLLDIATAAVFTCPARDAAGFRTNQSVPTWRYRFFALFDNSLVATYGATGVLHASEISYVFGMANLLGGPANTPAQEDFINYLQGAWATFAKNPTSGLSSSAAYQWPIYNQNAPTLVQLGKDNSVGSNLVTPSTYDSACDVIELSLAALQVLAALLSALGGGVS